MHVIRIFLSLPDHYLLITGEVSSGEAIEQGRSIYFFIIKGLCIT
jgi:hypothetical protein